MRYLLTGCFFSVAVLATMHTQAGVQLDQLAEPVVSVISTDGEHYNSLKGPGQPLEFMMSGQCTDNRNLTLAYVTSLEWAPITGNAGNFYVDLSNKPTAQSSELPPTEVGVPDGIYLNGVEYPIEWRSKIIDACNINLEQKQQYFGLGKNEVLAKSWDLKGVKLGSVDAVIFCKTKDKPFQFSESPSMTNMVYAKVTVKCERYSVVDDFKPNPKAPPTGSDKFKLNIGVNQASLIMVPATYQGVCPAELHASATIVTNGATDVKYRFENDKGELSPLRSIHVDQTNTAYVSVPIKIGQSKSQGGLAAAPVQNGGTPDAIQSAQPAANIHQGFYRLHIVAPNSLKSSPANFKVTCTPKVVDNMTIGIPGVAPPVKPAVKALDVPGVVPPVKPAIKAPSSVVDPGGHKATTDRATTIKSPQQP